MSRIKYTLSPDDMEKIYEAGKPKPVMFMTGGRPMFDSPQECANRVWQELADKYGFIWDTVGPSGEGDNIIFAEPKTKKKGV